MPPSLAQCSQNVRDSSIMVGVKAPTAAMNASSRGSADSTTCEAGVHVTTSGQSASAALGSPTTCAARPSVRA